METHLPAKPRRPLRIIHTSDVHLETDTFGSGERGVQLRDKVRNSFSRVIERPCRRESWSSQTSVLLAIMTVRGIQWASGLKPSYSLSSGR